MRWKLFLISHLVFECKHVGLVIFPFSTVMFACYLFQHVVQHFLLYILFYFDYFSLIVDYVDEHVLIFIVEILFQLLISSYIPVIEEHIFCIFCNF